jgi:hypothetical protein
MPTFQYWHYWVEAQISEAGEYPQEAITDWLNDFGANGWELVNMTPDWEGGVRRSTKIMYIQVK